jgi:hypothetical protein
MDDKMVEDKAIDKKDEDEHEDEDEDEDEDEHESIIVTFIDNKTRRERQLRFLNQSVIKDTDTDINIYVKNFVDDVKAFSTGANISFYPMKTLSDDGFIQFKSAEENIYIMKDRHPDFCTSSGFYDIFMPTYSYILTDIYSKNNIEVEVKERINDNTFSIVRGNNTYKLLTDTNPTSRYGQYKTCGFQKTRENGYRVIVNIPDNEYDDPLQCQKCGVDFHERASSYDENDNEFCLECEKKLKKWFFFPRDVDELQLNNETPFEVLITGSINGHGATLSGNDQAKFVNLKPCISMNRIGIADLRYGLALLSPNTQGELLNIQLKELMMKYIGNTKLFMKECLNGYNNLNALGPEGEIFMADVQIRELDNQSLSPEQKQKAIKDIKDNALKRIEKTNQNILVNLEIGVGTHPEIIRSDKVVTGYDTNEHSRRIQNNIALMHPSVIPNEGSIQNGGTFTGVACWVYDRETKQSFGFDYNEVIQFAPGGERMDSIYQKILDNVTKICIPHILKEANDRWGSDKENQLGQCLNNSNLCAKYGSALNVCIIDGTCSPGDPTTFVLEQAFSSREKAMALAQRQMEYASNVYRPELIETVNSMKTHLSSITGITQDQADKIFTALVNKYGNDKLPKITIAEASDIAQSAIIVQDKTGITLDQAIDTVIQFIPTKDYNDIEEGKYVEFIVKVILKEYKKKNDTDRNQAIKILTDQGVSIKIAETALDMVPGTNAPKLYEAIKLIEMAKIVQKEYLAGRYGIDVDIIDIFEVMLICGYDPDKTTKMILFSDLNNLPYDIAYQFLNNAGWDEKMAQDNVDIEDNKGGKRSKNSRKNKNPAYFKKSRKRNKPKKCTKNNKPKKSTKNNKSKKSRKRINKK